MRKRRQYGILLAYMRLKVLAWNIWAGTHYDEVLSFLRKEAADVVALQEVVIHEDGSNTAERLARELGYECVHALTLRIPKRYLPGGEGEEGLIPFGCAVLSRFPIVDSVVHDLSPEKHRPVIEATIDVDGTEVSVTSLHLKHTHQEPSELQNVQARALVAAVPTARAITLGDFNSVPGSEPIRIMESAMRSVEMTPGLTWSMYNEGCSVCKIDTVRVKLDYIFVTKDIAVVESRIGETDGSDHLPVIAILEI